MRFQSSIGFFDGVKSSSWRPLIDPRHIIRYDGHHKSHYHADLIWVDVHWLFITLKFTLIGSQRDRGIFNTSEPFDNSTEYFSDDEVLLEDTSLIDN